MKSITGALGICLLWNCVINTMEEKDKRSKKTENESHEIKVLLIPPCKGGGYSNDPLLNCNPGSPRTMAAWMQQYSPRPPGQQSSTESDCQTSMSCFFYYLLCNPLWYSCCSYRADYHENP